MESSSWRVNGPNDFRNDGGMLSGLAAPSFFKFLVLGCNSSIKRGKQISLSVHDNSHYFLKKQLGSQASLMISF